MNPPILAKPCFKCGIRTSETQSVFGVGHQQCYDQAIDNVSNGKAITIYLTKTYIEINDQTTS